MCVILAEVILLGYNAYCFLSSAELELYHSLGSLRLERSYSPGSTAILEKIVSLHFFRCKRHL